MRCRRSDRNALRGRRRPGASRRPCSPSRRASHRPPTASPATLRGPASRCETSASLSSVAPRARRPEGTPPPSPDARPDRNTLDDRLHHRLLPSGDDRDAAGKFETLPCVLPVSGGDKEWYLYAAQAGLLLGVASHRSFVSLTRSPVAKAPTNRPAPPPPFSPIMARRPALVGSQAGLPCYGPHPELVEG